MTKKLSLGVIGSGQGTDLIAIIEAIQREEVNAELAVIISDNKKAGILKKANEAKIKTVFIDGHGKSDEEFDLLLMDELKKHKVNLAILIGFMREPSNAFVKRWGHKCIDVHPSLLPAFQGNPGQHVYKQVLRSGVKVSGCTLHFLSNKEMPPIIMQRAVPVYEKDKLKKLKERTQEAEQELLIKFLHLFSDSRVELKNEEVIITESEEQTTPESTD